MTAPPEWRLYCDNRFTGIVVRPDEKYPSMFRIHAPDRPPSDMVNLTRAKDAALSWARPLTGQNAVRHSWKVTKHAAVAPPAP